MKHGTKHGPKSYLDETEEQKLSNFVREMGKIRYGKTHREIKDIAESVAMEKGFSRKARFLMAGLDNFVK